MFVIIGIAVDDIFVFIDMWKQAKAGSLRDRFRHTVHTAVKPTFFTSATSAASFGANVRATVALRPFFMR